MPATALARFENASSGLRSPQATAVSAAPATPMTAADTHSAVTRPWDVWSVGRDIGVIVALPPSAYQGAFLPARQGASIPGGAGATPPVRRTVLASRLCVELALLPGLEAWISVVSREDPPEHAQARFPAPAVGVAVARHATGILLCPADQGEDEIAENEREQVLLHTPRLGRRIWVSKTCSRFAPHSCRRTARSCHSPSMPLSRCIPRSSNGRSDPTTRSFTVLDTRISPAAAADRIRAARWA